jgi:hypothetical protein
VSVLAPDRDGRLGAQIARIAHAAADHRGEPHLTWEPVSGFEPLTCRLQEAGFTAPCALPALTQQRRDQNALNALAVAVPSFHEPFHANSEPGGTSVTLRITVPGQ